MKALASSASIMVRALQKWIVLISGLLPLLAGACSSSEKEKEKQIAELFSLHGELARTKIAAIKACVSRMDHVETDFPKTQIDLEETAVLWCEDLDGDSATVPVTSLESSRHTWFEQVALSVALGADPSRRAREFSSEELASQLKRLSRMQYVLIIRTDRVVEGAMVSGETFRAGSWSGRALLFRTEDGVMLGGKTFTATNEEQIRTPKDVERKADTDNLSVKFDLEMAIRKAIGRGVGSLFRNRPYIHF